jgi:GNAT superfamily N-acetyltransferase
MGIVFRTARVEDLAAVAELAGEFGHPSPVAEFALRMERVLADPAHALFVAEDAGCLLGWLHVQEFHALTSAPNALVAGLVVTAEARGRGLGRALLLQAEEWARTRGIASMRLRARRERKAAHGFYRALGYRVYCKQLQFRKEL